MVEGVNIIAMDSNLTSSQQTFLLNLIKIDAIEKEPDYVESR